MFKYKVKWDIQFVTDSGTIDYIESEITQTEEEIKDFIKKNCTNFWVKKGRDIGILTLDLEGDRL